MFCGGCGWGVGCWCVLMVWCAWLVCGECWRVDGGGVDGGGAEGAVFAGEVCELCGWVGGGGGVVGGWVVGDGWLVGGACRFRLGGVFCGFGCGCGCGFGGGSWLEGLGGCAGGWLFGCWGFG